MNKIKSFSIYREYYDLITLLSNKEQANVLLAIVKFMFDDQEILLNENESKVFINLKRPLNKSKKQSKNSTKQKPNKNQIINQTLDQKKTHHDVNINVYVNGNKDIYNLKFNFGKYKDCLVTEIFKTDKNYINWIYPRLSDNPYESKLKELIKKLESPSWYGKNIQEEKATKEEIKNLEERLNGKNRK